MGDRSKYYTSEDWEEIRNSLKERCDLLIKEKYELIAEFLEDLHEVEAIDQRIEEIYKKWEKRK